MSFQAMAWAVEKKLAMREKMVLVMLSNYASNGKGDCYPSIATLAEDCGASKDSVIRAIKALESDGFLTVNRRTQDGVNLPNFYTLNLQGVVADSDNGSRSQPPGVVAESDTNLSPEPIIEPTSLRSVCERELSQLDHLAAVLDADHAKAVVEHRKNFKAKFSPYAAKLLASKFAKCPDPNAAADAMIVNGWQGFEPEWMGRQQARGSPPRSQPANGSHHFTQLAEDMTDESERTFGSDQGNRHDARGVPILTISDYRRHG